MNAILYIGKVGTYGLEWLPLVSEIEGVPKAKFVVSKEHLRDLEYKGTEEEFRAVVEAAAQARLRNASS